MKITLIDKNQSGTNAIISGLSLCRNKQCTEKTLTDCMEALPIPHLAALEMSWYCFLVEGLSVKARIQLERHRHQSSIERSTRALDMSDVEFVIPETAKYPSYFSRVYDAVIEWYKGALELGETKEDASYLLSTGITTKFQLSGNGRVFFEYLQKRLCKKHVQREHYRLAQEIYKQLVRENIAFKYAHPCRICHKCRRASN